MPLDRVTEQQCNELLADAEFAVGLLEMVTSQNFDWDTFSSIYPRKYENLEERAKEMVDRVRRVTGAK